MKQIFASIALLSISSVPAFAQDAFEVPVKAEVIEGWVNSDGSRIAALRLDLAPGWKTYWRAPGDAGIPPHFDWSGSGNLSSITPAWPAPVVFEQNGMRSVGYKNTLTIPLRIEPARAGEPVHLKARMELGICADICIPHELNFDTVIDSDDTKPTPAIAAAMAQNPYSASEAGVTSAYCAISPTADGLQIEARVTMPSAGGEEYVVIEPGVGGVWVSEAKTHRNAGQVIAVSEMIHVDNAPFALDRSNIRITVLGSNHAVDIRGCSAG